VDAVQRGLKTLLCREAKEETLEPHSRITCTLSHQTLGNLLEWFRNTPEELMERGVCKTRDAAEAKIKEATIKLREVAIMLSRYKGVRLSTPAQHSSPDPDSTTYRAGGGHYFVELFEWKPGCTVQAFFDTPPRRVPLLGNFLLGEGKAENQHTALVWCEAELIQAIDCNQDWAFEQALFLPGLTSEFDDPRLSNIGFGEDILTKNWSDLGSVAAVCERLFGTSSQRMMSRLGVRLFYGHPDFFRVATVKALGLGSADYVAEDTAWGVKAATLGLDSRWVGYVEMGKARDVSMLSCTKFESKISRSAAVISSSSAVHTYIRSPHVTLLAAWLTYYSWISFYILQAAMRFAPFWMALVALSTRHILSLEYAALGIIQSGFLLVLPLIAESWAENGVCRIPYSFSLLCLLIPFQALQSVTRGAGFMYGMRRLSNYIASGRPTGVTPDPWRQLHDTFYVDAVLYGLKGLVLLGVVEACFPMGPGLVLSMLWCANAMVAPFALNPGHFPTRLCSYAKVMENLRKDKSDAWQWIHEQCAKRQFSTACSVLPFIASYSVIFLALHLLALMGALGLRLCGCCRNATRMERPFAPSGSTGSSSNKRRKKKSSGMKASDSQRSLVSLDTEYEFTVGMGLGRNQSEESLASMPLGNAGSQDSLIELDTRSVSPNTTGRRQMGLCAAGSEDSLIEMDVAAVVAMPMVTASEREIAVYEGQSKKDVGVGFSADEESQVRATPMTKIVNSDEIGDGMTRVRSNSYLLAMHGDDTDSDGDTQGAGVL